MKEEQSIYDVSVKNAIPLFFANVVNLSCQISIEREEVSRFILMRDRAYLSMIANSVGRANDLGLFSLSNIYYLPDDAGIFV